MSYKVTRYTVQRIDNKTFRPIDIKLERFAVYRKVFPFPNKTIWQWEIVKDGFLTEKEAVFYIKRLSEKE